MRNIVYRFSSKCFLTAGLTRKIEHRINMLYPASKSSVINRTEKYLMRIYILSGASSFMLMIFADFSLYYSCLTAMVVYVMISAYISGRLNVQEVKLLAMFEIFIEEVHFHYQFDGMILEAIEKAAEKVPYEMAVHGELILNRLKESSDADNGDYRDIAPNSLFLTFYSLSLTVLLYGDKETERGSVYLNNLAYLKENVGIEILKRKNLEGSFMGLSGVTVLPVFSIKIIEAWAVSNMPELEKSYSGFWGSITTIILFIITVGIYKIIEMLRAPSYRREYRTEWAKKLLETEAVEKAVILWIRRNYKRSDRLNTLLKSMVYPYDIKEFTVRRFCFAIISMPIVFAVSVSIGLNVLWAAAVMTAGGVIVYFMSYLKIILRRQMMIMESEEEIVRYQSVILILMHMDRITVEQILAQMRDFAVVFVTEIETMTDRYSGMGTEVFREIKENTGFFPLEKLMDNFMAIDMLGIENAFKTMESDRNYYVEKHKQENRLLIEKKAGIGRFLAFIPLCTVIIVKLILPFVLEGIRQLSNTGM